MKKIFILSALALGLSFPFPSHAEVSVFGVDAPVVNKGHVPEDNLEGGYVAQSLSDTFVVQKLHKSVGPQTEYQSNNSIRDSYAVFGVRVPVNPDI